MKDTIGSEKLSALQAVRWDDLESSSIAGCCSNHCCWENEPNRMNSAHDFITFFCTCFFFMEKPPTHSAFNFVSLLFSCPKGFYPPHFMLSSLFLFSSLWFLDHWSLSQAHCVLLCVLFSCILATSVTFSCPFPLSFTSLHFGYSFPHLFWPCAFCILAYILLLGLVCCFCMENPLHFFNLL